MEIPTTTATLWAPTGAHYRTYPERLIQISDLSCAHQMKKILLLWMAVPALAFGIPVNLDGPGSDFSAFTSSGYRVEHSATADPSSGLGRWWVSFFSAPGDGFDAHSFAGNVLSVVPGGIYSAVLVQGETVDGDYYSRIFRFKAGDNGGLLSANLGENFSNLSWLRISGFGAGNDFALKDVTLEGQNVPETAPGFLLMGLVMFGLCIASHAKSGRRTLPAV